MAETNCFRLPKHVRVVDRSSSITNSFINGIIPARIPTDDDVAEALRVLELNSQDLRCAYCGDKSSEWDHFRPLISAQEPTGYISEIQNLVPACGKCNQSKGNSQWKTWMLGNAKLSPRRRGIPDLDERVERLSRFERWREATRLDIPQLVGEELWGEYRNNWRSLLANMRDSQRLAHQVKRKLHSMIDPFPSAHAARTSTRRTGVTIEEIMTPSEQEMITARVRAWATKPHLNVHQIIGIVVGAGGVIPFDSLLLEIARVTRSNNPSGAVAGLLTSKGNAYGRVFARDNGSIRLHPQLHSEILAHQWRRDA